MLLLTGRRRTSSLKKDEEPKLQISCGRLSVLSEETVGGDGLPGKPKDKKKSKPKALNPENKAANIGFSLKNARWWPQLNHPRLSTNTRKSLFR